MRSLKNQANPKPAFGPPPRFPVPFQIMNALYGISYKVFGPKIDSHSWTRPLFGILRLLFDGVYWIMSFAAWIIIYWNMEGGGLKVPKKGISSSLEPVKPDGLSEDENMERLIKKIAHGSWLVQLVACKISHVLVWRHRALINKILDLHLNRRIINPEAISPACQRKILDSNARVYRWLWMFTILWLIYAILDTGPSIAWDFDDPVNWAFFSHDELGGKSHDG